MPRNGRSGTLSIIQAVAIDDRRMGAAELRVLVALGTYADPEGWCWPKQKQLAQRIGVSRQAVSKSLLLLEKHGYIEIHHQHDAATGSQISSRYRIVMDFELEAENRRTPQPDVAGGVKLTLRPPQRDVAAPATPEVAPPATSEVAPIERPIRTTHKERPIKKEVSNETSTAAAATTKLKVAFSDLSEAARAVVDDWRQKQGKKRPPQFNPTQAAYLEEAVSDLGVERLTEANTWAAQNGVPEFVKAIRAARTKRRRDEDDGTAAPTPAPQPALRVAPATDADRALWAVALEDLRTMNNAANFETYLAPLEVAGRADDGGLRLICNPLMVDGLRRFKNQISSALATAGDAAPGSVGFAARRRLREHHDAE